MINHIPSVGTLCVLAIVERLPFGRTETGYEPRPLGMSARG